MLHLLVENKSSSGEGKVRGRVFFKGYTFNFWKRFQGPGQIPRKVLRGYGNTVLGRGRFEISSWKVPREGRI